MSKTRLAAVPDVPTVDEAGRARLYLLQWNAVWAPKGTPADIVMKLNNAIVHAMADPSVRRRLADLGQEFYPPEMQTPEALGAFQKAELDKWRPIITAANIKGRITLRSEKHAMQLRIFGRTGMQLSVLGFGCGAVGGFMVRGDPAEQERVVARGRSPPGELFRHRGASTAMASRKTTLAAFCED